MATTDPPVGQAKEQVDDAARKARPVLDHLARAGYVAKGVVYLTVGILAGRIALGAGGKPVGTGGALETIGSRPLGNVLLALLVLGLLGYALWKLVQGVMDPDDKGSGVHGLVRRGGYVGSALIHGALAFSATEELVGSEGHSTSIDQLTAQVMSQTFGRWLVALIGLAVIGVGLYQLYAGLTARYKEDLRTRQMSEAGWQALHLGRIGTAARAVVILMAGFFVLLAAYYADPEKTRGLGGTLEALLQQRFGPYLLAVAATGLLAYGVFMLLVARHRRIRAT